MVLVPPYSADNQEFTVLTNYLHTEQCKVSRNQIKLAVDLELCKLEPEFAVSVF